MAARYIVTDSREPESPCVLGTITAKNGIQAAQKIALRFGEGVSFQHWDRAPIHYREAGIISDTARQPIPLRLNGKWLTSGEMRSYAGIV